MPRRVLVAALAVLVTSGLAACFSTPKFNSGGGDDDTALTGQADAPTGSDVDAGIDSDPTGKVYMDAPTVYMDGPTVYKDAMSSCVVGKPGTTCNL